MYSSSVCSVQEGMTAASQPPSPPAVSPCWPRLGFPPGHGLLTSHQPLCACFLHSSRTLARPVVLIPDASRVAHGAGVPWLTSQPEGWPPELCPGSCCTTESALREGDTPHSRMTGTASLPSAAADEGGACWALAPSRSLGLTRFCPPWSLTWSLVATAVSLGLAGPAEEVPAFSPWGVRTRS